jgi:hypothetical protein
MVGLGTGYTKPNHRPPKWVLVAVAATFIFVVVVLALKFKGVL